MVIKKVLYVLLVGFLPNFSTHAGLPSWSESAFTDALSAWKNERSTNQKQFDGKISNPGYRVHAVNLLPKASQLVNGVGNSGAALFGFEKVLVSDKKLAQAVAGTVSISSFKDPLEPSQQLYEIPIAKYQRRAKIHNSSGPDQGGHTWDTLIFVTHEIPYINNERFWVRFQSLPKLSKLPISLSQKELTGTGDDWPYKSISISQPELHRTGTDGPYKSIASFMGLGNISEFDASVIDSNTSLQKQYPWLPARLFTPGNPVEQECQGTWWVKKVHLIAVTTNFTGFAGGVSGSYTKDTIKSAMAHSNYPLLAATMTNWYSGELKLTVNPDFTISLQAWHAQRPEAAGDKPELNAFQPLGTCVAHGYQATTK